MTAKITCSNVARLLYLTDDEIDSQEALLLSKHIESCSSCNKTREDFLAARQMALQIKKGLPAYPDFTISTEILIKSCTTSTIAKPVNPYSQFWNKALSIIRYATIIAAVLLVFLFIWEQTISVRKISMLENRIQSTLNPSTLGLIDRITIARSIFTDKEWNDLAVRLNVKQIVSDPYDLIRIKILLENRIRSGKTNGLTLVNLYRNSSAVKRNAITFKNLIK